MPQVAIIGAGLIGCAWAAVFARADWNVVVCDADEAAAARAPARVAGMLRDLAAQGLAADVEAAAARVRAAESIAEAITGADFVQENTPETVESKRAVFAELDRLVRPGVVLASSTSSIAASRFTGTLAGRARCLVAHPVNPPHLVPLVELVGAPWTAPDTIAQARAVYESVGQVPIIVNREIEGFILNRLQGALLAEAFRLVGEGYVSPQDCDRTVRDGLGLRWSFMGPFETIDLNAPGGMADYCARYSGFYRNVQADAAGPEVFGADNVARILAAWNLPPDRARLDARMAWRDRRLAALVAHKRDQMTAEARDPHRYRVMIDDNFHYMDESDRSVHGTFASYAEAVAACKAIVDASLAKLLEPGMDSDRLYGLYTDFGDDPFIMCDAGADTGEHFSAWGYARQRSKVLTASSKGHTAAEGKPPGPNG